MEMLTTYRLKGLSNTVVTSSSRSSTPILQAQTPPTATKHLSTLQPAHLRNSLLTLPFARLRPSKFECRLPFPLLRLAPLLAYQQLPERRAQLGQHLLDWRACSRWLT